MVTTRATAALCLAGIAGIARLAGAGTTEYFWAQPVSGDWSDEDNWNPNDGPPREETDAAVIDLPGVYTVTADVDVEISAFTMDAADAVLAFEGLLGGDVRFSVFTQSLIFGGQVQLSNGATWVSVGNFRVKGPDAFLFLGGEASLEIRELLLQNQGSVRVIEEAAILAFVGITIEADSQLLVGANVALDLDFDGTVAGAGSLTLQELATLRIGNMTFETLVVLQGSDFTTVVGISGTETMTNKGTIRGGGGIGVGQLSIVNGNTGVIQSNDPAVPLTIWTNGDGMRNKGELRAQSGSKLRLANTDVDNTDGLIDAGDDSFVDLVSGPMTITGGLLSTADTGRIRDATDTDWIGLENVTIDGTYKVRSGGETRLIGTLTNQGRVMLSAAGVQTQLRADSDVTTIDGGGEIVLEDDASNQIRGIDGDEILIADNTIRGGGSIGESDLSFVNLGAVIADSDDVRLKIDPANDGFFLNLATLQAMGTAGLQIKKGPFATSGSVLIAEGSVLVRNGTDQADYRQVLGSTVVEGELRLEDVVQLDGGDLSGSGSIIAANVFNDAGVVRPGSSVGTLAVNGPYEQGPDGTLVIELGGLEPGTDYDQLVVTGTVQLDGTLEVELVDGFQPNDGDAFTILTAADVDGTFDTVTEGYTVMYEDTEVIVVAGEVVNGCPADLDGDGTVGFNDLTLLLGTWGPCPAEGSCDADLDGDDTVGFNDLTTLLGSWGPCE